MADPYHTALSHGVVEKAEPRDEFTITRGSAFGHAVCHDVWLPLPEVFQRCDIFYSDPPWPQGYNEFQRRAGIKVGIPYSMFATHLDTLAARMPAPAIYVVGRSFLRYFGYRTHEARIAHNGGSAMIVGYRVKPPEAADTEALLGLLAARYQCVGDCMCGYGRSGRLFAQAGKSFVLADFNRSCIGYIAAHAEEWFHAASDR